MDFGWFTTIPGMLITGGVLLLIIALIIFISTSNKKGKKNENDISQKSIEQANQIFTNQPPLGQAVAVDVNNNQMNTAVPEMDSIAAQNSNLQDMPVPAGIETQVSSPSNVQEPTMPVQNINPLDNSLVNGVNNGINNNMNMGQYQAQGVQNHVQQEPINVAPADVLQNTQADVASVNSIQPSPVVVESQVDNTIAPIDNVGISNQVVENIPTPVAQVNDVVSTAVETPSVEQTAVQTPVVEAPPIQTPAVEISAIQTPDVEIPSIESNSVGNVVPTESVPVQNTTPVVESTPAPINVVPAAPVETPPAVVVMPNTEQVQNDTPVVQTVVEQQPVVAPVSIYGGVSPTVDKSEIREEPKHEIYGGANPLDNTQPISINDIKSAEQPVVAAPQVVPVDQSGINS